MPSTSYICVLDVHHPYHNNDTMDNNDSHPSLAAANVPGALSTTSSTTTSTRTPPALRLREILSHIFTFNSGGSNFACALVCKAWCDVALDHIWAELPGPKPLALLLAPLVESDTVVEGRACLVSTFHITHHTHHWCTCTPIFHSMHPVPTLN